jgi:hypothetical protein
VPKNEFTQDQLGVKNLKARPFPNTYTFSKCLAEALVTLEGDGIPRAIVRPSAGKKINSHVFP